MAMTSAFAKHTLVARQGEICQTPCVNIQNAGTTCSSLGCLCTIFSASAAECSSCFAAQQDDALSSYALYLQDFLIESCTQTSLYTATQFAKHCIANCAVIINALDTCAELGCLCGALSAGAPACTSCLLAQGDSADKDIAGYFTVLLTSTCASYAALTTPTVLSTQPPATGAVSFQPGLTTSLNIVTTTSIVTPATQLTASTNSQKSSAPPHSYSSSIQTVIFLLALFVGTILLFRAP